MGFAVMGLLFNTGVHVFMYWYYFASNMGYNVWFKKYITTLQIIQFMGSFLISIPFISYARETNFDSWIVFFFSSTVNSTFLMLFINFYRNSYKSNTTVTGTVLDEAKKSTKAEEIESGSSIEEVRENSLLSTPKKSRKKTDVQKVQLGTPTRRSPRLAKQ